MQEPLKAGHRDDPSGPDLHRWWESTSSGEAVQGVGVQAQPLGRLPDRDEVGSRSLTSKLVAPFWNASCAHPKASTAVVDGLSVVIWSSHREKTSFPGAAAGCRREFSQVGL